MVLNLVKVVGLRFAMGQGSGGNGRAILADQHRGPIASRGSERLASWWEGVWSISRSSGTMIGLFQANVWFC